MRRILFLLLMVGLCLGYDRNYLMDSEDVPFEGNLLVCQIFRSFYPKSRLTDYDLYLIVKYSQFYNLSPFMAFVRMEVENNLTRNMNDAHSMTYEMRYRRAFSYWLWLKSNESFEKQLQLYSWQTDENRKHYPGPGKPFKLEQNHGIVYPISLGTWLQYRYCPFYGIANNCGFVNVGNRNFELVYQEMKPKWKLSLRVAEQISNWALTPTGIRGKLSVVIQDDSTNSPAYPLIDSLSEDKVNPKEVLP